MCKDLKFSSGLFTHWKQKKQNPSVEKLTQIANYFNVPINYLLNKSHYFIDNNKATIDKKINKKGILVPVLGYVQAGIPIEAVENVIDYEEISLDMAARGEYFALKVNGDSMQPRFTQDDVVIVRRQPDVESGDIAVILVNGSDATIKKIVKQDDNGIFLIASNSTYTPKYYTRQEVHTLPVEVLGKVVELRAKF